MTRKSIQKRNESIKIELLGKEIELRFSVSKRELKRLYHKSYEKFKEAINWLYWNKSLNFNDILKLLNWSQGLSTYTKINNALVRRKEVHNHKVDVTRYPTKCYLLGMTITDLICELRIWRYLLHVKTPNYYGCEYLFNVLNTVKHVILYPRVERAERKGEKKVLNLHFEMSLPVRHFEINSVNKFEVLEWISKQHNECIEEFLAACIDCDRNIYKDRAYLWNKDVKMLELIRDILKKKFSVNAEVREKESEEIEKMYYLYIDDKIFLSRVRRRLKHPRKKLSISRNPHGQYFWILCGALDFELSDEVYVMDLDECKHIKVVTRKSTTKARYRLHLDFTSLLKLSLKNILVMTKEKSLKSTKFKLVRLVLKDLVRIGLKLDKTRKLLYRIR